MRRLCGFHIRLKGNNIPMDPRLTTLGRTPQPMYRLTVIFWNSHSLPVKVTQAKLRHPITTLSLGHQVLKGLDLQGANMAQNLFK